MKKFDTLLHEAQTATIDINFDLRPNNPKFKSIEKKFNIKIKPTTSISALATGQKSDLIKFLKSDQYDLDDKSIKSYYPSL